MRTRFSIEAYPSSGRKWRVSVDGGTAPQWNPQGKGDWPSPNLMTSRPAAMSSALSSLTARDTEGLSPADVQVQINGWYGEVVRIAHYVLAPKRFFTSRGLGGVPLERPGKAGVVFGLRRSEPERSRCEHLCPRLPGAEHNQWVECVVSTHPQPCERQKPRQVYSGTTMDVFAKVLERAHEEASAVCSQQGGSRERSGCVSIVSERVLNSCFNVEHKALPQLYGAFEKFASAAPVPRR